MPFFLYYFYEYDKLLMNDLWPVGEAVNTLPSQGNIHGFKSRTGYHENKNV